MLTEENVARVESLVGDEPVCVSGQDPATAVLPGPQPAGGDGWTLLGQVDATVGELNVVGDPDGYRVLWEALGMGDEPPQVDFERHVVVALEIGYSGSCPQTRLDAVDFGDAAVRLVVNTVTEDLACTDDYNPRTYVVELERSRLPAPPFSIGREDWPRDAGQVSDDLRVPGSAPSSVGPAPGPPPEVGIPEVIEPGFPWEAIIDLSCGIEYLGQVNGVHWRTDESLPDEWMDFVTDQGLLEVRVLLTEGPEPTLIVTAGNHSVVYRPTPPNPTPCFDLLP